jgi:pyruvate formate lyase activating enzyme
VELDRRLCQTCGTCALSCPTGALEVVGRPYTVDGLFELIQQEQTFYEHSRGGVTFSGGEAASHHSFLKLLANRCKEARIHVGLDTCLIHEWPLYRSLLSYVDLWIVRLKLMDARHYKKGTGQGIWTILENARQLNLSNARVWVKTPILPGWTDNEANIRAIGEFIRDQMPGVERWELTSLGNLPAERYRALGQVFEIEDTPPLRAERLNELAGLARSICRRKIPVVVAGPTSIGWDQGNR